MTSVFKLLIDTNVVIGLEDAQPVKQSWADLVRLSASNQVALFVDGANYEDVERDRDASRREITLSKLGKFQRLRNLPIPSDGDLSERFGLIVTANDKADVRLLLALDVKAVDFLITEDIRLHRRAGRCGLASAVLTVDEALRWIEQTFQKKSVSLPYIEEKKAYEIDRSDEIFQSLNTDYPAFPDWFDKCCREHRDCWVLQFQSKIAGIVVRKEEQWEDARTRNRANKILKVCTFKVSDEFRGEKLGELLLKQILWYAQSNSFGLVYLTVFPHHDFLIDLLSYYGFVVTMKLKNSELVMEKLLVYGPIIDKPSDAFEFDRLHYPRFYEGKEVAKYIVPIRPDYHRGLFPEVDAEPELPLFPREIFGRLLDSRAVRTPGNTIRKVYLCRAQANQMRPGDLIFFYVSKSVDHVASQTIATIGVVEQVQIAQSTDDLVRMTAKRSVFSADDIEAWSATPQHPVKVIDFLLVEHIRPPVALDSLLDAQIFNQRPPQSITKFDDRYAKFRRLFGGGYDG